MDIEQLRDFCLSLPATTEGVKWDHHLAFMVGGKMYAITTLEGEYRTSMKVRPEGFDDLVARPGMMQAPYFAKRQWVLVQAGNDLQLAEWKTLLREAYDLVRVKLTKKLQRELGLLDG